MSKKQLKIKKDKKVASVGKGKVIAKKTLVKKKEIASVKKKDNIKKMAKPVKKTADKKLKAAPSVVKKQQPAKKAIKAVAKKKETKGKNIKSKERIQPLKKGLTKEKEVKGKKIIQPEKKEKEEKLKKEEKPLKTPFASNDFFKDENSKKSKRKRKKKKNKDDDEEPEIIHDELVEQLLRQTKKLRSQPKVPKILKTFTNPMASLTVAQPDNNSKKNNTPKKEPKGKFQLEYVIRTSSSILYEFITTPSGLSEWFADDVNIHDGIFTFFWDGSEQKAKLISFKEEKFVRLQWLDKPEGSYFEFKIEKDELTSDVSLIITDFADEASDLDTSKRLWDTQIDKLLHVIGSY